MSYEFDKAGQQRLNQYIDGVGDVLGNKCRRSSFAMYALGILGDGERKSVEPIAARASPDEEDVRDAHQKLLHFLRASCWEDTPVRRYSANHALAAMTKREQIETWSIDDTGFLKQGKLSPCVQRQYTGSAGKRTNCQLAVSLTVCTPTEQLAIDMELYLPKVWAEDKERRAAAKIPGELEYRPKWKMALDMIGRAVVAGVPPGIVLGDSFYGDAVEFRDGVSALDLTYALDVKSHTHVRRVLASGQAGKAQSVLELAKRIGRKAFRRVTWRQGTRNTLASRFAMIRVVPSHSDRLARPEQWLLIEWPTGEAEPTHFVLSTVGPKMTLKRLVQLTKQRWRIERTYEDLKGELGLDHFEGRTWPGWNHHVTVVLSCYAFVVSEKVRSFSPSAARPQAAAAFAVAA